MLGIDARAGIGHGEHHVGPGRHATVRAGIRVVQLDVLRLDHERSAVGHRVGGVDHEIHHNLLELIRVAEDRSDVVAQARHQLDVLLQQAPKHPAELRDHVAHADRLGFGDRLPAEREQLARQQGGAPRGRHDLVEVAAAVGVVLGPRQELGV